MLTLNRCEVLSKAFPNFVVCILETTNDFSYSLPVTMCIQSKLDHLSELGLSYSDIATDSFEAGLCRNKATIFYRRMCFIS